MYSRDMNQRRTLVTDLNVFADFQPRLPAAYRSASYVLLGNIHPALQATVLEQTDGRPYVGGDTMNFWIERTPRNWPGRFVAGTVSSSTTRKPFSSLGCDNLRRPHEPSRPWDRRPSSSNVVSTERLCTETATVSSRPDTHSRTSWTRPERATRSQAGFMGYLAGRGFDDAARAGAAELRRAMIYGSVMGSFCCERFGVERLQVLTKKRIEGRFEEFREQTTF